MVERLGEMREERGLRKGAERGLQRKEEETKLEKEGLRDPPFIEFSRSYKLEFKHQNLVFKSL